MRFKRLLPLLISLSFLSSCTVGDLPGSEDSLALDSRLAETSIPNSKEESSSSESSPTASKEESSLAHVHTYSESWSYDEENHWRASTCGHEEETKDKAPHSYGEWNYGEITKEGKQTKSRKCSVCGKVEAETLDYLGDDATWASLFPKFRNFTLDAAYNGYVYKCLYTENMAYLTYTSDTSNFARVIEYLDDRAVEYDLISSEGYWESPQYFPYTMMEGIDSKEDCVKYSFNQTDLFFSKLASLRSKASYDVTSKAFIIDESDSDWSFLFTVKDTESYVISVEEGKLSSVSYSSNNGEANTTIHNFGTTEDDYSFKEKLVTYSEEWSYDETYHWHSATSGDLTRYKNKGEHTFTEWSYSEIDDEGKQTKSRKCSVCGKEEVETLDYYVDEATWNSALGKLPDNFTATWNWGNGEARAILTEDAYYIFFDGLANQYVDFYYEFEGDSVTIYVYDPSNKSWEKINERSAETDSDYTGEQSYRDYVLGANVGSMFPFSSCQYGSLSFDKEKGAFCGDDVVLTASGSQITLKHIEIKFCQGELFSIEIDNDGDGKNDMSYFDFGTSEIPSSFKESLHDHTFDEGSWESNEYYHWHPLTCGHTSVYSTSVPGYGYGEHVFDAATGKCTVCLYQCEHSFSSYSPEVCTRCGYRHTHEPDESNICTICGFEVNEQLTINGLVSDTWTSLKSCKSFTLKEEVYEKSGDEDFALISSSETKASEDSIKKSDSLYWVKEGEKWQAYSLNEDGWSVSEDCENYECEREKLYGSLYTDYERIDENTLRYTSEYGDGEGTYYSHESTLLFESGVLVSLTKIVIETTTLDDGSKTVKKTKTVYSDFDSTTVDLPDFAS